MTDVTTPAEPVRLEADSSMPGAADAMTSEHSCGGPVLISEQEVRLATTATAPVRRRWNPMSEIRGLIDGARSRRRVRAERRPVRHDQPSRCAYLERSQMAREMDRL
ncbi:MAG: hypothetical protein JST91_15055 [Actinobacteria bacterium]|nr:hypothetical protein [Actinomycetota bacterium]